jgi:hypothetical protein
MGEGVRRCAKVGHLGLLPLDHRGEHVLTHEAGAVLLGPHVAQVLGLPTHARLLAEWGCEGWWGEGGWGGLGELRRRKEATRLLGY